MKQTMLILILLISVIRVNCQASLKNNIKLTLLSVVDPINPSVDIAYERFLKEKRSFQFGLGYILPTESLNNKGFKIRTEYRFYKSVDRFIALNSQRFIPQIIERN